MARRVGSSGTGKDGRRCIIPGIWEAQRRVLLKMIEDGDPRLMHDFAPGLTDAERQAANASQHSGPSRARWHPAALDRDGWTEVVRLSAGEFPAAAAVPWLTDRSVPRLRISADDSLVPEPASPR